MILRIMGGFICLALAYIVWQYIELKRFGVTEYTIDSPLLKKEHGLVVLADLHGFSYGANNGRLMERIRSLEPALILIAGDMIVSKYPDTYKEAVRTLASLTEIAPVYYAMGNHESRANREGMRVYPAFVAYQKEAKALGVHFLQNERALLRLQGDAICLSGLEIGLEYYEKGTIVPLDGSYLTKQLGASSEAFQILLAHNPAYSEEYAAWGADLTFCGHYHGGLIRLPKIGSLLSPQLTWFPKYNSGSHRINGKRVIISRGLGTHTFHIRIFNRAELVCVHLKPGR